MTWRGHHTLLLVIAAMFGCQKATPAPALLTDHACRCASGSLARTGSLRVSLEGLAKRESACIPIQSVAQLTDLQAALRTSVTLKDLSHGTYKMTFVAYEDSQCGAQVVACGQTTFALPGPTIDLPVYCLQDLTGQPATISATRCLEQKAPVGNCTTSVIGDAGVAPDGGAGLHRLNNLTLVLDKDTCSLLWVSNVDSLAVALYSPGGGLLNRRCIKTKNDPKPGDLLANLAPPIFDAVPSGPARMVLTGHDGSTCQDDDVVICSAIDLVFPVTGPPTLNAFCFGDGDGTTSLPITEAECIQQAIGK
ncbi:MAG: hypothetical protein H6707_01600 [Deltaproteobacteria bacterium]|nr:hypothetical protein [Deltaproteobacteria bacterium]